MRVTGLNPTDELLSFDVYQVLAPKMETTLSVGVILTTPSVACAVFPPTVDTWHHVTLISPPTAEVRRRKRGRLHALGQGRLSRSEPPAALSQSSRKATHSLHTEKRAKGTGRKLSHGRPCSRTGLLSESLRHMKRDKGSSAEVARGSWWVPSSRIRLFLDSTHRGPAQAQDDPSPYQSEPALHLVCSKNGHCERLATLLKNPWIRYS